jgi:hypothetical protein
VIDIGRSILLQVVCMNFQVNIAVNSWRAESAWRWLVPAVFDLRGN